MRTLSSYKCPSCGKKFKNSASLSSHKYRYHPYLKNKAGINHKDDDVSSLISDVSSHSASSTASVTNLHSKIDDNTHEIKALDRVFGRIVKRVEILESQISRNLDNDKDPTAFKMLMMSRDIEGLQNVTNINKDLIFSLRNELYELLDDIEHKNDDISPHDLVKMLLKIKDLFLNRNYSALPYNISNLKGTFLLLEKAFVGKEIISPDLEALITRLSKSSSNEVIQIIQDNFDKLVVMFESLKEEFDQFSEDNKNNYITKSENGEESEKNDMSDTNSYSTDEIESEKGLDSSDSESEVEHSESECSNKNEYEGGSNTEEDPDTDISND